MHQRNKNILWALFNIPIHFNSQPNNRMDGLALHKHIVKYQELYSVKHDKPAEWKRTMQLENYLGFHPWELKTDKIHWKIQLFCQFDCIAMFSSRLKVQPLGQWNIEEKNKNVHLKCSTTKQPPLPHCLKLANANYFPWKFCR